MLGKFSLQYRQDNEVLDFGKDCPMMEFVSFVIFVLKEIVIDLFAGGIISLFKGDIVFSRGWRRRKAKIEPALLYQHHRKHASEDVFWRAFKSKRDVMLVTIKSLHTRNRLKEMIESGEIAVRSLRILTLNPELPSSLFEALAKQINEPVENCITDCRNAHHIFQELTDKYKFVEVRRYDSLPTIQGVIVSDDYAFVELLTYQSNPEERTALMISKTAGPNSLQLFEQRFEKLWRDAKP